MQAPCFKKWFAQVPALNQPQRLQTLAALHPAAGLDQLLSLIGEASKAQRRCLGVHRNTAFRWRHRFLDRVKHDRPSQLGGIV